MKLVVVICMLLLSIGLKAGGIEFQNITLSEALLLAKEQEKPIFIDIYATWCGPCKYLSRNVFTESDLGDYMNQNFVNLKLDGEKEDGGYLMEKFELDAFPTMLFINGEEEIYRKIVGAVDKNELFKQAKYIINPESSPLYTSTIKYEEGERSKAFLLSYTSLLFDEDQNTMEVVEEYLKLYPDLDMENRDEFLVFCLGITDLGNEHIHQFLDNIEHYDEKYEEFTFTKLKLLLLDLAIESKHENEIHEGLDLLYEPFSKILDEPISKKDLTDSLIEIMNE